MFPEEDPIPHVISEIAEILFRRRLVDRVLLLWKQIARGGRLPRRDEIEPLLGADRENCAVIAVQSPIKLSHFVVVGSNLSGAHCPNDNLAGVFLCHLPQIVSERRCLMIEDARRCAGLACCIGARSIRYLRTASKSTTCSARQTIARCTKMRSLSRL